MSKYTTGEMAKLCNVSVRTVQFYDTKGLMPPSELTDGGRRLYTDDDLVKLRLICMLKALGLKLDCICKVLNSKEPAKLMTLLLDEQLKQLGGEITEKQTQIDAIKIVKESIHNMDAIPVNSIHDIDTIMKNRKNLDRLYHKIIAIAIPVGILQWGSVALWIFTGIWILFAIAMPIVILIAALLIRMLHKNRAFICAECDEIFKPRFWQSLEASNTARPAWILTCTHCGHHGVCVEVYAKS